MFIMNCDDFVSVLLCWHMCVYHALCCTLILVVLLCLAYIRGGNLWPTCIRRSDVPVSVESGRYTRSTEDEDDDEVLLSAMGTLQYVYIFFSFSYTMFLNDWFLDWLIIGTKIGFSSFVLSLQGFDHHFVPCISIVTIWSQTKHGLKLSAYGSCPIVKVE